MASAGSSKNPRGLYLLKQNAMKFYEINGVPTKMEDILNSMFYEDPPDVYGHLVNYFSQFTKPAMLCRMSAVEVFDAQGLSTCQTDVFCTVNNKEKHMSSATIPTANQNVRPEDCEKAEHEVHDSVLEAIKQINTALSDQLVDMDPLQQKEIDAKVLPLMEKLKEEFLARKAKEEENVNKASPPPTSVEEKDKKKSAKKPGKNVTPINVIPDRAPEVFVPGSEAVAAVSQAVCACAAASQHIPVYRHVSHIARTKGAIHEFRIPLPMVTIIQSGKFAPGKSNCIKEYMVVPGVGMPINKSIEYIHNIYKYVAKYFVSKMGVTAKFVTETGALCPLLDTPTQALDLLQEAVNAQGLTIGEDMHLAITAAAHEFFDYEKGKYEVITGQLKTGDDMVEFWTDILAKYPSILAIIDPLRGQDSEVWMKLCERVSEAVFIIGDHYYDRPGILRKEEVTNSMATSGLVMCLERMNSVSDIIDCSNKFTDANNEIIIAANQSETNDVFLVDLAVGLHARFLKLGGPCRGERSCKLNRLLHIYHELDPADEVLEDTALENSPSEEQTFDDTNVEDKEESKIMKQDVEKVEQNETKESEISVNEVQEGLRWGEGEKSKLKLHTPFKFPLIQNSPPPEEVEGEGDV